MAYCANCGNPLTEGQQFCASCGQPAGQGAPGAPPGAVPPYGAGQPYGQAAWTAPQKRRGMGLWIALASLIVVIAVACILVFVVFKLGDFVLSVLR